MATSQDFWKPSTTKDALLGDIEKISAVAADKTLFWVTSAGAFSGPAAQRKPNSTDVAVVHFADSGELFLQYVLADGAIQQGQGLQWSDSVSGEVKVSGSADELAGVALCDVGDNEYFWMAIAPSTVEILVDSGGIALVGNRVITAASGEFDETGATNTNSVAKCLETGTSTLVKAVLL